MAEPNVNDITSTLGNTSLVGPDVSDDDEPTEKTLKFVVLGDGLTGKTSVCTRFAHRTWNKKYSQTVGVDFFSRRITLPPNVSVMIQIWDIGGQNLSANMLNNYMYGANAVLFVYDVSQAHTFENVAEWLSRTKDMSKTFEKAPQLALVGNKTDLEHRRAIKIDKHNKFAIQYDMKAYYMSAKTGDNVDLCFKQIAGDTLGLSLNKQDLESDIEVIKAPLTVHEGEQTQPKAASSLPLVEEDQPHSVKESLAIATKNKKATDSGRNSAVCSLQ